MKLKSICLRSRITSDRHWTMPNITDHLNTIWRTNLCCGKMFDLAGGCVTEKRGVKKNCHSDKNSGGLKGCKQWLSWIKNNDKVGLKTNDRTTTADIHGDSVQLLVWNKFLQQSIPETAKVMQTMVRTAPTRRRNTEDKWTTLDDVSDGDGWRLKTENSIDESRMTTVQRNN